MEVEMNRVGTMLLAGLMACAGADDASTDDTQLDCAVVDCAFGLSIRLQVVDGGSPAAPDTLTFSRDDGPVQPLDCGGLSTCQFTTTAEPATFRFEATLDGRTAVQTVVITDDDLQDGGVCCEGRWGSTSVTLSF